MADDVDPETKTEDASPRRREEARKQGQIPFSAELVGAAVLLAGLIMLSTSGKELGNTLLHIFRHELMHSFHESMTTDAAQSLIARVAGNAVQTLLPLFGGLLAAGVGASILQVGFQITPEKIEFDPTRLDPSNGFSRLFSSSALVKGLLGIVKVIALASIVYVILSGRSGVLTHLSRHQLEHSLMQSWSLVGRLGLSLAGAVALIAAFDYFFQRRKFEISIRMTKDEVKREMKEDDGDPQVKARVRQLARDRAKRRMMSEVPKSTVVITNPTHYAVALRYESDRDSAPVVVAKGTGYIAKRIVQLARERSVPVVERPPLARALYAGVKEGRSIPAGLFRAVAEVIAFVYRIRGVRRQAGTGGI